MIPKSTDGRQRVLSLSYGKDSLACLGAIEQLGWPLDRIVHAEVWFDDDTPADLPPMVEFKEKADAIIKERYGIEVEHTFAVRGGRRTHTQGDSSPNTTTQTARLREETKTEYSDSLSDAEHGAIISKLMRYGTSEKLTYCEMFYKIRGGGGSHTRGKSKDSRSQGEATTVCRRSKGRRYGFPIVKGNWCTAALKRTPMAYIRIPTAQYAVVPKQAQRRYVGQGGFRTSPDHAGQTKIA